MRPPSRTISKTILARQPLWKPHIVGFAMFMLVVAFSACSDKNASESTTNKVESTPIKSPSTTVHKTEAQPAAKTAQSLPPLPTQNGKVLYAFLSEQIPEVISKVPCTCCNHTLDWCYQGGCPFG